MKLRRRLSSSTLVSLFFFAPVVAAALVACGSDDDGTSGGADSGTDAPVTANPDGSPFLADAAARPDGAVDSGDAATNPDATVASGDAGGDSGESEDGGGDATTGGGNDGGNDGGADAAPDGGGGGTVDAAAPDAGPDAGPIVQKSFPLATPGLGGYALVDAFPNAEPLDIPAAITWAKTDTTNAHAFVLERTGIIRRMADDGTWDYQHPLVDFGTKVNVEGEGGAVGMILHPKFGDGSGHDFIYVWYNACAPNNQNGPFGCGTYSQKLERYTFHPAVGTAKPYADTPTLFIEESEFQPIHNAGRMLFGPSDGFLYFGNGDDGDDGTYGNHQTVSNAMFAGIFRIDVDSDPTKSHAPIPHTPNTYHTSNNGGVYTRQNYFIPNDNPYASVTGDVEEFWAFGFRNPYSWSFDQATGKQFLGDVGDSFREEVDLITKNGNYGWPIYEGDLTNLQPDTHTLLASSPTATAPLFSYSHASIADLSSIFGGFIYHGSALPELDGKYLYTDWITDHIWSLDLTQSPPPRVALVEDEFKYQPVGWGQDNSGEVYLMQYGLGDAGNNAIHGGHVKKLARDTVNASAPTTLSGTFLFKSLNPLTPADNLVPYTVASPLWSDGAVKQRWIMVPAGQKVSLISGTGTQMDGNFKYPAGTMLIKQFDMATDVPTPAAGSRHLETRVMVVGSDTTYGYTFRWRPDGSDADIVRDQQDQTLTDSTGATRDWHYPSPGQCWGCHRNGWEDEANTERNEKYRILGFTQAQLGTQVMTAPLSSIFDATVTGTTVLPTPDDTSQTIGARAYAYLSANCSQCHHLNANYTGSPQTWIATYGAGTLAQRYLNLTAYNYPMTVRLSQDFTPNRTLTNGTLVVPGSPDTSVLLGRIESNDPDTRMPPIARNVVDTDGAAIIRAWIAAGAPPP